MQAMRKLAPGAPILALALASAACDGAPPSSASEALYVHESGRYRVVVERSGADPALRARVEPHEPWKLSPGFPFELESAGEGVRLERPRQTRAEALEISERRVEFAVPVAPLDHPDARQPARVAGTLWFGICEDDGPCERVGHEFDLVLR